MSVPYLSRNQRRHLDELHARARKRTAVQTEQRDAQVLIWRGEGLTYARIAARLGVNRARAHQIVVAARKRMEGRELHGGIDSEPAHG